MAFSAHARGKNFTLENLKSFLEVYKKVPSNSTWMFANEVIDEHMSGYTRTHYQVASQMGIEYKEHGGTGTFVVHNYLYSFDDLLLEKYLSFWSMLYFAPNPRVSSPDKAINIFIEISKNILQSPDKSVNFSTFFSDYIGGSNKDITRNALKHSIYIYLEGDDFKVHEEDIVLLTELVSFINCSFPIPSDKNDKKIFFNRFSKENFILFYSFLCDYKTIMPVLTAGRLQKEKFILNKYGQMDFSYKNLLLKGVPGTGKSQAIESIIENNLSLKNKQKNICRINIHSASSNADLMQGIGISTNGTNVEYKEKQGLIYNHIKKALFSPNQPFVLVLEEIQENSLNELIGDLIYLIEDKKRVTVDASKFDDGKRYDYQAFINKVLEDKDNEHYIEIPFLVDTSTAYRKMVLSSNLYVFCTSNYKDDKKVIEDNLLRRFDVVEIYPQTQEVLGQSVFKSKEVSDFLSKLNDEILKKFENETHPDRYLVGHANWLDISEEESEENKKVFYTALLKVLIEFKEIREVDFASYTKEIIENVCKNEELPERLKEYIDACDFEYKSYKEMVEKLQKEIYGFLK